MLKNKKIGGNNDTKHCTCNRNKDGTTATCECKSSRSPIDPLPPTTSQQTQSESGYTRLDSSEGTSVSSEYSRLMQEYQRKSVDELNEEMNRIKKQKPTPENTRRLQEIGEALRQKQIEIRRKTGPSLVPNQVYYSKNTQTRQQPVYEPLKENEHKYDNYDYNTAEEEAAALAAEEEASKQEEREGESGFYSVAGNQGAPTEKLSSVANATYNLFDPRPNHNIIIPSETSTDPTEGEPQYLDVAPENLTARYDFTVEQKQNMLKQIQEKFDNDNLREENYEFLLGTEKEETISIIKDFLNRYNTPEQVDLLVENLYDRYPELSSAVLGYSSAEDYVAALKKRRMTLDQDQLQTAAGKKSKKINKRKSKKNKRKSKKVKKSKSLKAK
jgi:hypothetical protein